MCNCRVCIQSSEFHKIILQLPDADKEWMVKFYSMYCNEMVDANVNEAIIEGTWLNSDDIIKHRREHLSTRNNNDNKE